MEAKKKGGRPPLRHCWCGPDGKEEWLSCRELAAKAGLTLGLVSDRAVRDAVGMAMPGGWRLVQRGAPKQAYIRRRKVQGGRHGS